MNEYLTLWQAGISMLGVTIGSVLYGFGGLQKKWVRRWLGSFIIACCVNGICLWRGIWSPLYLLVYPFLGAAWTLPYGADSLFPKIIKRTLFALASCACGLIFCFVLGGNAWFVLIPHVGIGLWSVYLGVKNPIESAAEQFFICVLLTMGLMMYPFVT